MLIGFLVFGKQHINKKTYPFLGPNTFRNLKNLKKAKYSSCGISDERIFFAHRGGNLTKYQENTIEVFMDSVENSRHLEMDLILLISGEIIAFHDLETFDKTGFSYSLLSSTWNQIKGLSYLKIIERREYKTSPKIPLLKDALAKICTKNNNTNLWFDLKYSVNLRFIKVLLDTLEASPCACDNIQNIVVEVHRDTLSLFNFRFFMQSSRCKVLTALSYYEFQAEYPLKYLVNELNQFSRYADIIDFHVAIIKKYPELLAVNTKNNICNSIYGDDRILIEEVSKNPLVDIVLKNFYD